MDRTTEDKLMSNVSALKNELDNFYLNGLTPEVTALAARICDLAGGHDDLIHRYNDLERLLESLTPGGSEFSGDPEACAAWVRARLSSVGKLALERNRYNKALQELENILQFLSCECDDELTGDYDDYESHFDYCPIHLRGIIGKAQEATE